MNKEMKNLQNAKRNLDSVRKQGNQILIKKFETAYSKAERKCLISGFCVHVGKKQVRNLNTL